MLLRRRRPSGNRKLPQRRPLGARLPAPRAVLAGLGRALRRAAPTLIGLATAGALAGGAVLGHRWLMRTPRFALRDIVIDGNRHVGRDEVVRRAGVREGQSLFTISPRGVEAALAHSPWVAEVEARRHLPDRLDIHIVEHQPSALVHVDGAGLYLADAAGRPFKRAAVEEGEGADLLVVSGLPRVLFQDDRGAALVARALAVGALWLRPGRPPLGEVHLARDGFTLRTLEGGVAVVLGRGADEELAAAMRRFDAIWASLPREERARARRIHLDSRTRPDRVTVSLADATR